MKRLATLVLLGSLLAGCNLPLSVAANGAKLNQPVEPLAGVTFKPLSAANARLIGTGAVTDSAGGAGVRAAMPASASAGVVMEGAITKAAPAPSTADSGAGGGFSGNVYSYYGYRNYFGGFDGAQEPMALVSVTEAETVGGQGAFQDVVKTVAAPVVKAWAKDARLVQSNASLGSDGQPYANPDARQPTTGDLINGYWGDQSGWRMTYLSPERGEVLNFFVRPDKTLILRMRWAPLDLAPEAVTVDSAAAIQKLSAAIKDKSFRGEEEKTGLDYFLGTTFEQPQMPGVNEWSKSETVYDMPAKTRWNVSLQSIMGKLVWEVSYASDQPEAPMTTAVAVAGSVAVGRPAPDVAMKLDASAPYVKPSPVASGEWRLSYFNNSGSGMVDAQTGAVIRFTRPMKNYYRDISYPMPQPSYEPKPTPAPTSQPSAPPSDEPELQPDATDSTPVQ